MPKLMEPEIQAAHEAFALYEAGKQATLEFRSALAKAMRSRNAEFLVELGEELFMGARVNRDIQSALRCFSIAETFVPYMAHYALGRFYWRSKPSLALQYFARAAKVGHITSLIMAVILEKRLRSSRGCTLFFVLRDRFRFFWVNYKAGQLISRGSNKGRAMYWRYFDLRPNKDFESIIGRDRNSYFPWSESHNVESLHNISEKIQAI